MSVAREIKVGAFVFAGLCAIGLVIFLIGDERQLFSGKVDYQTVFTDVQGLKRGSPVRMGGVDIGSVSRVSYGENPKDNAIYVSLSIVEAESRRIRADSVASIAGKGLLGDKMIVITAGSPGQPWLNEGATIASKESDDLGEMMSKLGGISNRVDRVVENLEATTGELADQELYKDLKSSVDSLSHIFKSLETGDGFAARLLHDKAEADRISRVVSNVERMTARLAETASGVNEVVQRVNDGPGLAHELIYGEEAARTLTQFGGAADEVSATLRGIREGNGLIRGVLFGDDQSQLLARNLTGMTEDLRQIVSDVRAGKGTLGALLVDPSVYEDVKLLLGNVQRNKSLRALVRYSIKQDEAAPVQVRDPVAERRQPQQKPADSGSELAGGSE